MSIWVTIYANLVRNRMKKIEDVPEEFRAQVEEILKNN